MPNQCCTHRLSGAMLSDQPPEPDLCMSENSGSTKRERGARGVRACGTRDRSPRSNDRLREICMGYAPLSGAKQDGRLLVTGSKQLKRRSRLVVEPLPIRQG